MSTEPDAADPQRCSPCRGTGELISTLGGEPKRVPCSWCEGSGCVIGDHDAQERWRAATDRT